MARTVFTPEEVPIGILETEPLTLRFLIVSKINELPPRHKVLARQRQWLIRRSEYFPDHRRSRLRGRFFYQKAA